MLHDGSMIDSLFFGLRHLRQNDFLGHWWIGVVCFLME